MPGTGKHGYTGPSLYGGSYNISNGIVQSGSGASSSGTASRNSPYGRSVSGSVSNLVANSLANNFPSLATDVASNVANISGTDSSDYGDYVRELLTASENNTAQSQAFAREQMEYQRQSDANAMAWSAAEAQKNRDWQERLSNSAHQREVKDLIAAGLNPILSANAGAYTGSGATGQAFSSSGAMGNVDSTGLAAAGSLIAARINAASNAAVAKMYTDADKYQADLAYSSSRLATEASILNNQNSTSAQKWIATQQMQNDLEKTTLSGQYGLMGHYIDQETSYGTHGMDNDTKKEIQKSQEAHELKKQSNQIEADYTMQDKEILAQYEKTALQLMNGNIFSVGGFKGAMIDSEKFMREITDFLAHPYKTYQKWRQMEKSGNTKGSILGYIFGFG